jgi:hypothetical protein
MVHLKDCRSRTGKKLMSLGRLGPGWKNAGYTPVLMIARVDGVLEDRLVASLLERNFGPPEH